MAADIGQLVQILDATFNPQLHTQAEAALKTEAEKPQFSLKLLQVVSTVALPTSTRQAAALYLKNFLLDNYAWPATKPDEPRAHKLGDEESNTLKQELVGLMISSPPNIQAVLAGAINIIAEADFWERWDTLVPDLASRLSTSDFKVTNGVLDVAHSIFVRWRPLELRDVAVEVLHVVEHFSGPFQDMLLGTADATGKVQGDGWVEMRIRESQGDAVQLKGWLGTLSRLIKILYDLTCQQTPEFIHENRRQVCDKLIKYLSYMATISDSDDDEETVVETIKADICSVLSLFFTTHNDDLSVSLDEPGQDNGWSDPAGRFILAVANLLATTGPEKRYDTLVSAGLKFLTDVGEYNSHHFGSEEVLAQIVEKVITPNISLRESDVELFEDEPIEFIRRDLQGTDSDSRRRAATDCLNQLLKRHKDLATNVVGNYIQHLLQKSALDKSDWKSKDVAIYLFLFIASEGGSVTASKGIATVRKDVDVIGFFEQHIAADLINDEGVQPISKVGAIKYLHNLRGHLRKEQWNLAIQPLIRNMASSNYVVYTYAVITVERVLMLTDESGDHLVSRADIEPFAQELLGHLLNLVEKDKSPAKMQENEFLMKCIMRVLIVIKDGVVPILDGVLNRLVAITNIIKENPSNPHFYYYHFEAIGALIRYCAASESGKLEARLWEPFRAILDEGVPEFSLYVLQLLSAQLEASPTTLAPGNFINLLRPMLDKAVWIRGNIPAFSRFVSAVALRIPESILAENLLESVLGIFEFLFQSPQTQKHAFDVLEAVVISFPPTALDPYFDLIFETLCKDLFVGWQMDTINKASPQLKKLFAHFYHVISAQGAEKGLGADYFDKHAEAFGARKWGGRVFPTLYLGCIVPSTGEFVRPVDRKLAVISYLKTLCDSKAFAEKWVKTGWASTCRAMLGLLVDSLGVTVGAEDEITGAETDDIAFGVGFTALNTCKRRDDLFPEVTNVQIWVAEYIKAANARHGGRIEALASQKLEEQDQLLLKPYLA